MYYAWYVIVGGVVIVTQRLRAAWQGVPQPRWLVALTVMAISFSVGLLVGRAAYLYLLRGS